METLDEAVPPAFRALHVAGAARAAMRLWAIRAGPGVDALPLEMLLGRTRVIEVTTRRGIGAEDLGSIRAEDVRVLIKPRSVAQAKLAHDPDRALDERARREPLEESIRRQ